MTMPDTRTVPVATGVNLEVLDTGSGTPLVLVCGTSQDLRLFAPLIPVLAQNHRVIAYNHRGIGASTRDASPLSVALLAEDLAALLDTLGVDSAHVLGWSLGSAVAQEHALARPEQVASLVLVSTWAKTSRFQEAVLTALRYPWASGDRATALGVLSSAYSEEFVNSPEFEPMMSSVEPFFPSTPEAIATVAEQFDADRAHDTLDRLPSISAPTLVVAAEKDLLTPLSEGRRVAEAIPGAELHVFSGVGASHAAFMERGEEFLGVVNTFLGRLVASAAQ